MKFYTVMHLTDLNFSSTVKKLVLNFQVQFSRNATFDLLSKICEEGKCGATLKLCHNLVLGKGSDLNLKFLENILFPLNKELCIINEMSKFQSLMQ